MTSKGRAQGASASTIRMYDDFGADYDRFVDWESRLAAEIPFLERQLRAVDARRVLDAACGTGMHALALAERGYEVVGTDLSEGMIEQAHLNAARASLDVQFKVAGFGDLVGSLDPASSPRGTDDRFDALLCLGNSLPHLLTREDLMAALHDFAACLRQGGLLLIQNRNFDAVLARRERWMSPQTHQEGQGEWLFLRFYDFDLDGLLTFNVVRLRREKAEGWSQQVTSTRLWPQTHQDLTGLLTAAGFETILTFGNLKGDSFDPGSSPNLVMAARRS